MNIEDIRAIDGHESMTPQEIADALNANPLHHRDAPITGGPSDTPSVNFLHLMTARFKVMRQDKNQSWVGPLVDFAETNQQIGFAMGMLYPHLQVKDSVAFCSSSTEAASMVNGIVAAIGGILEAGGVGTTQAVVDAVALLTGGRKFGSVTAEQVETTIAEAAEADRYAVVSEATENKIQQVNAAMRLAAAIEGATIDDVIAAGIGEFQ